MSRFTRPPFHKPSPFDIPRPVHPPSPPETEITADSVPLPPMSFVSRDLHLGPFTDMGASSSFTRVDTPETYHNPAPAAEAQAQAHASNGRFRRTSNLSYLHPGSMRGDLRAAPRSATRWLLMVIPPPPVVREHGNGTFLNAASHTSHQGVLLPLLPSLSGQLSAIAREFAFPSTTGICIYLQMSDGGIQFTPRISDESWSILWGSVFDERQSSISTLGGLPIAGRIEFDLDLRKARWFDMWLASVRHSLDVGLGLGLTAGAGSVASASRPGSLAANHRREDSRTTTFDAEDSVVGGPGDDVSVTVPRKTRHVPRKLSLLNRIDLSSIKPLSRIEKSASRALSPTETEQPRLVLSPVAQTPIVTPVPVSVTVEDGEPQTATRRVDIEKKVETWRASSNFTKSPLVATTGQTALDPANMPNNVPLVETDTVPAEDVPLNLDDFTWSISSAGPLSADYHGPISPSAETDRPPSVHLDARLEGSVCLTPTTCTSFGPPDYDPFSPVASLIDRLPSPDIALRQFEDVPPTPTTATSWGPPSEWPGSPASISRAPSIDIALRQYGSRPVTPTTATSWGAPVDWPDSPAPRFRAPSVDIAMRELGSRPATPSTATSWGAPSEWPNSPATSFHVHTPGVGHMFFDGDDEEDALLQPGRVLRSVSAAGDEEPRQSYLEDGDSTQRFRTWKFVWPYQKSSDTVAQESVSVRVPGAYPRFSIYPAVYPHFDLYPARAGSSVERDEQPPRRHASHVPTRMMVKRAEKPWNHVWPYQKVEDVTQPVKVRLEITYPSFDLYPSVYPHFDLYPAKPVAVGSIRQVDVRLPSRYPVFSIYPATYPAFEIYPGHVVKPQKNPLERVSVRLGPVYPCIQPYSPVYPHFDLYPVFPAVKTGGGRKPPQKRTVPTKSPQVNPSKPWKHVWPYQHVEDIIRPVEVRLHAAYPSFNLYPAVYPHFDLYPSSSIIQVWHDVKTSVERPPTPKYAPPSKVKQAQKASPWKHVWPYQRVEDVSWPVQVRLQAVYPSFDLYPVVYPHFDLYPEKPVVVGTTREVNTKLEAKYPSFSIYPAVYPDFEVYPGYIVEAQKNPHDLLKVELPGPTYPSFCIYPAVYPYFDIYASGVASTPEYWREPCRTDLQPKYPVMDVYPAVYPYFDIYASGLTSTPEYWREPCRTDLQPKYPMMDVYPAVYPYFDIYASGVASTPEYWREPCRVELNAKYPVMDVYPAVYPYFDIYASGVATTPEYWREPCRVELDAKYPSMEIYPPVYPNFDIYKSGQVSDPRPLISKLSTKLGASYPAIEIYPAVYPNFDIYPSIQSSSPIASPIRRTRKTHEELVKLVFSKAPIPTPKQESIVPEVPQISVTSPIVPRRARRTHRDLVELVMTQAPLPGLVKQEPILPDVPQISVTSPVIPKRARRTHKDLVELVFTAGPPEESRPPVPSRSTIPARFRKLPLDIPQDVYSAGTGSSNSPVVERLRRSPSSSINAANTNLDRNESVSPSSKLRHSHIPIRPSDIRRSNSLGQATMPSGAGGISRSASLSMRQLNSVKEESARESGLDRSGSLNGGQRRERGTLAVGERKPGTFLFSVHLSLLSPSFFLMLLPRVSVPNVSMKDLTEFPMPPLPPLLNGRPVSTARAERPVAKLDRTKFPFR